MRVAETTTPIAVALITIVLGVSSWANPAPVLREWVVEGVPRQAMVYAPESAMTNAAPLVFVFHGHGGSMRSSMRTFRLHVLWPEAIVVYPQGLKTPGRLTDPQGKRTGWQHGVGDQEDRDLKFFDAMLTRLNETHAVDEQRIFSTGHSNGGGFTYLLWATRGDRLAAVAPSAAAMSRARLRLLQPKPVLHLAGEKDTLVKFEWQVRTLEGLRRLNRCGDAEPWMEEPWCRVYPSQEGAPVVTGIHPGGHKFPERGPGIIVKFFKSLAPS